MKTSELTGTELDRVVGRLEENRLMLVADAYGGFDSYSPSTNWRDGGPIIEREQIAIWFDGLWQAGYFPEGRPGTDEYSAEIRAKHLRQAETPLVAAMRAYVASKFGDEVPVSPQ